MHKRLTRSALAITGLAAALTLTACSQVVIDPSMKALRYDDGKYSECVEPGTEQYSEDDYYPYPTTQREAVWDSKNYIEDQDGDGLPEGSSDYPDLETTDRAGNPVYLRVKVSFNLNTECAVLRSFHEKFGKTRKAWFNEDSSYNRGWLWAMTNYIGSAAEQEARKAVIPHSVEDIWRDPALRDSIAAKISETIQKTVNDGMEGKEQFYTIGSVRIFDANPSDETKQYYLDRKEAEILAETAELNKASKITELKARRAVAKEEALLRKAEIAGYGGDVKAYLEDKRLGLQGKLVDKGENPFQPEYHYGGAKN